MIVPRRSANQRILSMVLAGGEGKRLLPLTLDRAKPAVPFGGQYRLIDFALSNLVNGGFLRIVVLTQYKSHSLDVHISRTWRMSTMLGNYVTSVPAQMRRGPRWFLGSADAMFQNLNLVDDEQPEHVFVFGADHIYRIDPRQMLEHHRDTGAGVTVAAIRMARSAASQFGVIEVGDPVAHSGGAASSKIVSFQEKPADPPGLPDSPDECLVSMGNYLFDASVLVDVLHRDATDETFHDIGGDLIPRLVADGVAHVYDFTSNVVAGETERDRHYWRDVGTLEAYFEAQMDLVAPYPVFNLYNDQWPIYTAASINPPAKVVVDGSLGAARVENSMLSNGVIVSGASVRSSVLSPGVRVDAGASVDECVLLDRVHIGAGVRLHRCIVDKNVEVPPGVVLDVSTAKAHGVVLSSGGVVAVAKNHRFDGDRA